MGFVYVFFLLLVNVLYIWVNLELYILKSNEFCEFLNMNLWYLYINIVFVIVKVG